MAVRFEWDPQKAAANLAKHNVSFEQARDAFRDLQALDELDDRAACGEERFNLIGAVENRLLVVTYTLRSDATMRKSSGSSQRGQQRAAKRGSTVKANADTPMRKVTRGKVAFRRARMHDWTKFDALTDADVLKAACSDPDAQPLSDAQLKRTKRPNPKVVRRALGLSQEQFADVFGIPIGTLRDWEQGRAEPDQAARSYLKVIAYDPEIVRQALKAPA